MVRKAVGVLEIIRTFRWARAELARTKERLAVDGVDARALTPIDLSARGYRGLYYAMRGLRPSCLERALVLQAWHGMSGPAPDVVVGVRKHNGQIEAHAWLDDVGDPLFDESYEEITRLPA